MKDFLSFIGLIVFATAVVWVFVWWQRELITNPSLFWLLIAILLLLSFWTSATEAAYAVVNTLGDPPTLVEKLNAEAQRLSQIATEKKFVDNPALLDNRRLKRLVARRSTLRHDSRDNRVGAFASASVFLNTALVAFIPVALASGARPNTALKDLLNRTLRPEWHGYISGEKWLTFATSTLLLLILGKIVPKMVGFAFPYIFAYRFGRIADIVHFLFGWIARGARYPLQKVLSGNRAIGG